MAENSVQGSGDRFVLGTWDNQNGIAGGYIAEWRANGGMVYNSHPDVYAELKAAFPNDYEDILREINQAAIQKYIDDGLAFDYSLLGLEPSDVEDEIAAIGNVEMGDLDAAKKLLGDRARLMEVQMLVDAGYTSTIDQANNIIHWMKP